MTTLTPKVLYTGGALTNVAAALYTCPPNTRAMITTATFLNTNVAAQTLTVYIVRSGGAAGTNNTIIGPALSLPGAPAQGYVSPELPQQQLAAGDSIWAYSPSASGAIVCAGISGFEITN